MEKPRKFERSTFARNVVLRRYENGISGMKLAEMAEMPYPTLRDIESGRSQGSKRNKEKIAKALGTTVDALNTPTPAQSALKEQEQSKSRDSLIASIVSRLGTLNDNQLGIIDRAVRQYSASQNPTAAAVGGEE